MIKNLEYQSAFTSKNSIYISFIYSLRIKCTKVFMYYIYILHQTLNSIQLFSRFSGFPISRVGELGSVSGIQLPRSEDSSGAAEEAAAALSASRGESPVRGKCSANRAAT